MDAKITLSFNAEVIAQAKAYANSKGISLSRLTEYLFTKMTTQENSDIYALPINDWVLELSKGKPCYIHKARSTKELKKDYYNKFDNQQTDSFAAETSKAYKKNNSK